MKLTRYKIWIVLAIGAGERFLAAAQSNSVPGPTDYSRVQPVHHRAEHF
jgi:hypothetical protein